MNFYTSRNASCFLTSRLLVIRFLRKEGKVYGKIILDQEKLKENQGGKTVLIKTCQTENERIRALRDHFDINLTETEKRAISGKDSAIVF